MLAKGSQEPRPFLWNFCLLSRSGGLLLEKLTHSFQIEASKHRPVGCLCLPEGGLLVPPAANSASQPGGKRFLEIFSQGLFPQSWGGPRGPTSQGNAKPHGQVYALWESSSEPHLSGTFLAPIKTPLCVKLHSLSGGLKCAAMHLLENPSTYSSLALTDVLFL